MPEDHERVLALKKVTKTLVLAEKSVIEQTHSEFFSSFIYLKAVVYKILKYKKSVSRNLLTGFLFFYYPKYGKKKSKQLANVFHYKSTISHLKMLWNILDSVFVRKLVTLSHPSINTNLFIFLPRTAPFVLNPVPDDIEKFLNSTENNLTDDDLKHTFCQNKENTRIPVRVLSNTPLPGFSKQPNLEKKYENIIIHMHGGGFIASSSFTHQNYTRNWALTLDVPIFSIEYRLSPEHPFPAALDDVWQTYF